MCKDKEKRGEIVPTNQGGKRLGFSIDKKKKAHIHDAS